MLPEMRKNKLSCFWILRTYNVTKLWIVELKRKASMILVLFASGAWVCMELHTGWQVSLSELQLSQLCQVDRQVNRSCNHAESRGKCGKVYETNKKDYAFLDGRKIMGFCWGENWWGSKHCACKPAWKRASGNLLWVLEGNNGSSRGGDIKGPSECSSPGTPNLLK